MKDIHLIEKLEKEIGRCIRRPLMLINSKGNLTSVNLENLGLREFPKTLLEFEHLDKIYIGDNNIKLLPDNIVKKNLPIHWDNYKSDSNDIDGVYIKNNPLIQPPIEIAGKGNLAIVAYFKDLEVSQKPLDEIKLILVGDGASGKTSLVKRLVSDTFDYGETQTDGINIEKWDIKTDDSKIFINIWDFGGQEIMHSTHQFFLTKRSVYLLVLDGRKDEKAEYWLRYIDTFGNGSPVIIAINKIDETPSADVNRKFLKEKYPFIVSFHKISCALNSGIDELSKQIINQVKSADMLRSMWPESWFKVKETIENIDKDFISYSDYTEVCRNNSVLDNVSVETLIDFLNDIGVIIHFWDLSISDTKVLNPRWVTEGVYSIINSNKIAENIGVLDIRNLDNILDKNIYPKSQYKFIIDIMIKFELCYYIDENCVLIPDLLGLQETPVKFNSNDGDLLNYRLKYEFLPKSIIPSIIVRLNNDIEKDDNNQTKAGYVWRTGVLLKDKSLDAKAIIKSDDNERTIIIVVQGAQKRDFFSYIRKVILDINSRIKGIKVTELIPLPDKESGYVEYNELLGLEKMGQKDLVIGKTQKKYDIYKLLSGIVKMSKEKKDGDTNISINNFQGILGDVTESTIEQSFVTTIKRNDKTSLVNYLLGQGIDDKNIDDLCTAIDTDPASPVKGKYGDKVSEWMGNMITLASNGTWAVSVGTAANVIGTALSHFYGLQTK